LVAAIICSLIDLGLMIIQDGIYIPLLSSISFLESLVDTDAVYFFVMCLGVCILMYAVDIYFTCTVKFYRNEKNQVIPEET